MPLGKKAAIPPDQKDRFILAGAMHLFAISGLHVAIVAGLFILLLRLLPAPRWAETTLVPTLLFLYVQITGGAPSAIRAFIMIAFWKASGLVGKRGGAFPALVASAVLYSLLTLVSYGKRDFSFLMPWLPQSSFTEGRLEKSCNLHFTLGFFCRKKNFRDTGELSL